MASLPPPSVGRRSATTNTDMTNTKITRSRRIKMRKRADAPPHTPLPLPPPPHVEDNLAYDRRRGWAVG